MKTKTASPPTGEWVLVVPRGRFPHGDLVQVLEAESLQMILNRFKEQKQEKHFTGTLIDFDHGSLDPECPSTAAGWIEDMRLKPDGIWGKIRWSDEGTAAVNGGRFKSLSPCFQGYYRNASGEALPCTLKSCALTNSPRMPITLSNRRSDAEISAMDYKLELTAFLSLDALASDAEIRQEIRRFWAASGKPVLNRSPRLSWQEWQGGIPKLEETAPPKNLALMNGLCLQAAEIVRRSKSPESLRNTARKFPQSSLMRRKLEAFADKMESETK